MNREWTTKARNLTAAGLFLAASVLAGNVWAAAEELGGDEAGSLSAAHVETAAHGKALSIDLLTVNNTWLLVATMLVFIMHLGFAAVESGLNRAKNAVNILFKNTMIPAIGLLTYAVMGFGLMFPGEHWLADGFLGFKRFWLAADAEGAAGNAQYTYWTFFLFQGMFAATAATIVSGAVCERIKLKSFLLFSTVYVTLVYPICGSWAWGGGWLARMGFHDFAGSTLVHSVGGWAALVGAAMVGPRLGKYGHGETQPIMGHNMPLVTTGVFMLWLGWFGFNGGSVLSAEPDAVSVVIVNTCLAASAGCIGAMLTSWGMQGKPDLTMVLNGILAGLVGITAGADVVSAGASVLIGLISGVIVVLSVLGIDHLKIDDPVGAVSVHLVCGVWGTLAAGLFGTGTRLGVQLLGTAACAIVCLAGSAAIFKLLKTTIGLRVSKEEEIMGLDVTEHGMEAYPDFQGFLVK